MFGLDFLFFGALFALPLAGLPVLLHLMNRRQSPIIEFPTLRFIRASMQRTASRRRAQKWLLLAARVLMLLVLILAAAQPARQIASSWLGGGQIVAAVVVDTSYSMLYRNGQQTLLDNADQSISDLLRNELSGARVAIYRSLPNPGTETLKPASDWLTSWTSLKAEPSPQPLSDRIGTATRMLEAQQANQKWLIVVTDMQNTEFPRPLNDWDKGRQIVIDLHPTIARSAGVVHIAMDPTQPIPGIGSEVVTQITGRSGDSRAVTAVVKNLAGQIILQTPPQIAKFDQSGQVEIRLPIKLPSEPWMTVSAQLNGDDDLPWDNTRSLILQSPTQRQVKIISIGPRLPFAETAIKLALDPLEGHQMGWPLRVNVGRSIDAGDEAIVCLWNDWPDDQLTRALHDSAGKGRTIINFVRRVYRNPLPNCLPIVKKI